MGKYSEKIKRNGTGYRGTDVLRHHEKYWKMFTSRSSYTK